MELAATPPTVDRKRRRRFTRRIGLRLVVIAIVPALGLSVFASNETLGRRDAAGLASDVQHRVAELSQLVELRFSLTSEAVPTLAISLGPQFGVSIEQAEDILGAPISTRLTKARADVDRLFATMADDPLVSELASATRAARSQLDESSGDSFAAIVDGFDALYAPLDAEITAESKAIWVSLPDELDIDQVRVATNQLLQVYQTTKLASEQLNVFFNAVIPRAAEDSRAAMIRLAEITATYQYSTSGFDESLIGDTAAYWKTWGADEAVTTFEAAVADTIAGQGGALLVDLPYTRTVVRAGLDRLDRQHDFLRVAESGVHDAAVATRARALSEFSAAILLLTVIIAASMFLVFFVGRSITRPLNRLSRFAEQVSAGNVQASRPPGHRGPQEVEALGAAFQEVVDNLRAIDEAALRLASGHFDEAAEWPQLPGRLGVSLQATVNTLMESINDREELHGRLAHESTHDGLTGLPNRSAAMYTLESALARATRRGTGLAVLFIDIDDFKRINDSFGQAAGDELLREVAHRLGDSARTDDTVARLGSDEFLVIAEDVASIHQAVTVAERVLEALRAPFMSDSPIRVSASVGISLSVDGHSTGEQLVREADLAVHRARGSGRGHIEIFDSAMRAEVANRDSVELRLAAAIRDEQLMVNLQPVVAAATLRIEGFEALVRWRDADGNFIPPDDFIPIAEQSDLILELDRYVLRHATAELASWPTEVFGDLHVAVNVSGRHLIDRSIVGDVADALMTSGLDPRRLVVEITETVLLSDLPVACAHLEQLREMGVSVALDDFGSGYTSLATLRFLPVDVLKIDRSIVNEMQPDKGQSLVRLIIEAAHEFGMTVVAEGVETEAQRELLDRLGCEQVQGWLFSPAVPADRARELAAPVGG